MEFDYEDYYEQSELEELREEYLKKAEELFNKDLKKIVEQTKEVYNFQNNLIQREKEIEDKERALEDKERALYNQLRKELGLDLDIGQIVYIVKVNEKKYICTHCGGKGRINIEKDGIVYKAECPHCYYGSMVERKYETVNRQIEGISYRFYVSRDRKIREKFDYETDYIALTYESRTYKRKEIYLTLEEAQKACDELNQKEQERIKQ